MSQCPSPARAARRASLAPAFAALAAVSLLAAPPAQAQASEAGKEAPQSLGQIQLSYAPVVKTAAPAVVNIYATRVVERRRNFMAGDPFFDRFFGQMLPKGRRVENSLGSGVVVSPDGLTVTNLHVVGEASTIRVVTPDKREFDAEVLLSDPDSDLVVLKLKGAQDLPALELRDSDEMEVGDLVLAIGNPFGVGQTVTTGIVSAKARSRAGPDGQGGYYLQTDAAINPGNSGGALVDMRGRLVGINTAILSRSGGSIGIGFAIPSDLVRQVVAQAEAGRATLARPWAGLSGQPVDGALAEAMDMDLLPGLAVTALHDLSPFARAGVSRGDVILSLDGRPVGSINELEFRLAAMGVGGEAPLVFLHDGERREAPLRLTAAPEDPPREAVTLGGRSPLAGLTVANMNPAVAEELHAPMDAAGVVVTAVAGHAQRAGFHEGDMIREVNGAAIDDPESLERLAGNPPSRLEVLVERDGKRGVMRFRL